MRSCVVRYGRVWYGLEPPVEGMDWYGMDWYGLVWTGMDWVWTGMDWYGLDGMDWTPAWTPAWRNSLPARTRKFLVLDSRLEALLS